MASAAVDELLNAPKRLPGPDQSLIGLSNHKNAYSTALVGNWQEDTAGTALGEMSATGKTKDSVFEGATVSNSSYLRMGPQAYVPGLYQGMRADDCGVCLPKPELFGHGAHTEWNATSSWADYSERTGRAIQAEAASVEFDPFSTTTQDFSGVSQARVQHPTRGNVGKNGAFTKSHHRGFRG